ncbi:multicopper oxidase domain-containing protein [Rhizobacter sp. AJA081-3]|uniref:multicopper oxidase domain-containing protein n=1 Tax=Rhizobacter sp. AJA081-3 TaxID=2753607 RepID=UPI001AE0481D|nr:multicopper oxidase domain-containing protein [Rhizobacter sp. AJA081-3]QTN23679.1 multicopper oxidase domain-containing protein [Rhizobacter sp. AJA081-3]
MSPNQILHRAGRWLLAAALAMAGVQAQAAIVGASGTLSAGTRSFEMFAGEGYPSMADGVQIYSWGYGASTASGGTGLMQISGPTLLVQQGETVSISFTNNLPTRSSMLFPGQVGVTASGGTAGVLAQEAAPGQTVTYTFTAGQPGTYLYQSGSQPGLQVEMGMVGALIVYPSGNPAGSKWAYNHIGTAYDRESLFVVGDIDSDIHAAIDEQVRAFRALPGYTATSEGLFTADLSKRFPKYWTLNGRTSPDVFAKNFAGELPHQPYNTLPRLHPGEKMLLRMIGAGTDLHPMHHHGNNSWAIARDGRMLGSTPAAGPNLAFSDYTIKVVPGQTLDALWSWTGAGLGWDVYGKLCNPAQANPAAADYCTHTAQQRHQLASDIGKPIPVKLPSEFELAYGEFYSGSPYLGDFGIRPVGAGAANTSGGYFHMFHSHNEREVVNGGIFPGGMMTMLVIEPHGVTIDVGQP